MSLPYVTGMSERWEIEGGWVPLHTTRAPMAAILLRGIWPRPGSWVHLVHHLLMLGVRAGTAGLPAASCQSPGLCSVKSHG